MSLNTQIGTSLIKNGSIVNEDISGSAAIDMSKINGLETALNGKEASLGNPNANGKVLSSTTAGVRSWVAISSGGETVVTSVSSLYNIDCSLGSYYLISISTSNNTISLINITSDKYYIFVIKNTSASSITITLPSGAIASNGSFTIASGLTREFSMIFTSADAKARFQVSGELNVI